MVKCGKEWYVHFVLKTLEVTDEPETVISIDIGEHKLAATIALSKNNPRSPRRDNSGAARRSSA